MSLLDLLKSRGTKIVGGSGIVLVALNLMNDRINSVQKSIDEKEIAIVKMVDNKHESVLIELRHLGEQQKDMKTILEKIDQRVYEMNKKQVYSNLDVKVEDKQTN